MTQFAVARRLPQWPASLPAAAILYGLLTASLTAANAQTAAVPEDARPTGLWERDRLTGDWGGLRTALEARGIALGLTDTSEVLGNVSGGMKQGAVFDGKTEIDLDIDLEKLVGWTGGRFRVSAYQIHGRDLSTDNIGNLLTVSNIEAVRGTRLADLYLEQSLFEDVVNIRIGQFAADEEFLTSDVAGVFINSTFGWPGINGVDLPGGGPSYPFSTPGIRVRYSPTDAFSLQAAAFNGNPLGQHGDQGGIEFPLDGVFAIVEASYSTRPGKGEPGLGGTFKIGAWYNSLHFDDLHIDNIGLSLADPLGSGIPASHTGNFALYGSIDHMLWRKPGTEDGGLSGFVRFATTPRQDRSPIYVYVDAGLTWKGTFPGRDDDIVGVAFAWANLSHSLRSLDHDVFTFTGVNQPIQSSEMVLEVPYKAPITPWLMLQPDFQYIIRPGGGVPNPNNPTSTIGNAAVFGLRSVVTF
jgi:porin